MKFNHAFTIAFAIESDNDGENITAVELLEGLEQRVRYLRRNPEEILEACGLPFDTYEIESDQI